MIVEERHDVSCGCLAAVELDERALDERRVDLAEQSGRAMQDLQFSALDVDLKQNGGRQWFRGEQKRPGAQYAP